MAKGTAGQTKDEVTNGLFLQLDQGWTLTAGWGFKTDPRGIAHSGGITDLSQDLTGATHTTVTYDFYVVTSGITAGTVTVKEGSGATGEIISTNGEHNWQVVLTTDTVLSFTPTTDFDGTIQVVRVRALKVQP